MVPKTSKISHHQEIHCLWIHLTKFNRQSMLKRLLVSVVDQKVRPTTKAKRIWMQSNRLLNIHLIQSLQFQIVRMNLLNRLINNRHHKTGHRHQIVRTYQFIDPQNKLDSTYQTSQSDNRVEFARHLFVWELIVCGADNLMRRGEIKMGFHEIRDR